MKTGMRILGVSVGVGLIVLAVVGPTYFPQFISPGPGLTGLVGAICILGCLSGEM